MKSLFDLPERVQSKIEPCPTTGCWIWTAHIGRNGYGVIRWRGSLKKSHRVVYEELVMPIPNGLEMDHLCRNRPCCNPLHL